MTIIFSFILPLAASVIIMPRLIKIAEALSLYDTINDRKIHNGKIPRIGGIGIGISVLITLFLIVQVASNLKGFVVGLLIIFTVGLYDDFRSLGWKTKFIAQFLAAGSALFLFSPSISEIQLLDFIIKIPEPIRYIGILLFIVGGINSINLLDGLDGLASGVTLLIFIGYVFWGYTTQTYSILLISLTFSGAILGFLRYNVYPAKIFLGDSGSLLLGYAVTTIPLFQLQAHNQTLDLTVPLIIITIPVLDTIRVSVIRIMNHKSPFRPDKNHLHHKLLKVGIRHDLAVLMLYGLNMLFIILSFFVGIISPVFIITIYSLLLLYTLFYPYLIQSLNNYNKFHSIYKNIERRYKVINLEVIARKGANEKLLRYSILTFLLTQIWLLDYSAINLYPLAFLLSFMIIYFYLNTRRWSDQFLLILVLFAIIYFQSSEFFHYPLSSFSFNVLIDLLNTVSIVICTFIISCILISNKKGKSIQQIIKPIDYLVLIALFLILIMPISDPPFYSTKFNLAKAAIIYIGIKSLFTYSIKDNRFIVYSVIAMLMASGILGAMNF